MDTNISTVVKAALPLAQEVVLADESLVSKVKALLAKAEAMQVSDDAKNEEAGALLKEVTALSSTVEKSRAAVNKPYYDMSQAISRAASTVLDPLEQAKKRLKVEMGRFHDERERARTTSAPGGALVVRPPKASTDSTVAIPVKKFSVIGEVPALYLIPDMAAIDRDVKAGVLGPSSWLNVWEETQIRSKGR